MVVHGGASSCEEASGPEGEIMKASVTAAVFGLIVAIALGAAAANGSAKSSTNVFHASVVGGDHYKRVPIW